MNNMITIVFVSTSDIAADDTVTIKNILKNTAHSPTDTITLQGTSASSFSGSAWTKTDGTLVLTAGSLISAGTTVTVSTILENPANTQSAVAITIEATIEGSANIAVTDMDPTRMD